MLEENKTVVLRIVEDYWNRKNPALLGELFAASCSLHTPDGVLHGQTGAEQLYDAYVTAFPDFRLSIDDIIAEDNRVVVRYTFSGTHTGPLLAIQASGRQANVQGVVVFRVDGGMVNDVRFVWDKFALMEQIGALPLLSEASGQVAS